GGFGAENGTYTYPRSSSPPMSPYDPIAPPTRAESALHVSRIGSSGTGMGLNSHSFAPFRASNANTDSGIDSIWSPLSPPRGPPPAPPTTITSRTTVGPPPPVARPPAARASGTRPPLPKLSTGFPVAALRTYKYPARTEIIRPSPPSAFQY